MKNHTESDLKNNTSLSNFIPTISLQKTEEQVPVTLPIGEKVNPFYDLDEVFSKPKDERTQEEVKRAIEALKTIQIFRKFTKKDTSSDEFIMNIYKALNYEVFNKDEAIYHHGEKGSKFYLILKGTVCSYVPKDTTELANDISAHKEQTSRENSTVLTDRIPSIKLEKGKMSRSRRDSLHVIDNGNGQQPHRPSLFKPEKLIKSLNYHLANSLNEENYHSKLNITIGHDLFSKFTGHNELYFEEGVCKFKKAQIISLGSYFGEAGLTSDQPRDMTAIPSTTVHVITLTKWAYEKATDVIQSRSKAKWSFFSELLNEDSKEIIKRFVNSFREEKKKYGQKILQQGEMPKEVYIICQGEVQIVKQEEDTLEASPPKLLVEEKRKKRAAEKKVANLSRFAFLGEGEALTQKPYSITAISISNNTMLYATTIEEFMKLKRAYGYIFEKIDTAYKTKAAYWDRRLVNLSQTQEKIQEDLNTPQKRSMTPGTLRLKNRSEFELSETSSSQLRVNKRDGPPLSYDNSSHTNLNSPFKDTNHNTPNQKKPSKTFTFDSIYTELHEDIFANREKKHRKKSSQPKASSISLLKPLDTLETNEEYGEGSKRSDTKKSRFSFVEKTEAFDFSEQIKTPISNNTQSTVALQKLFKEKLFQSQTIETNVKPGKVKSLSSKSSLAIKIPEKTSKLKETYKSGGSTTKEDQASINDSKWESSSHNYDSRAATRINSAIKQGLTSPSDRGQFDFDFSSAAVIKSSGIRFEDHSAFGRPIGDSKLRVIVPTEPALPKPISRGKKIELDMASLELASPFSKKKITLSLSLNNFTTIQPVTSTTKTEKILETIWPNLSPYAPASTHSSNMFRKTWGSETFFKSSLGNKPITASKHNMFRVKPLRAHLGRNYSSTAFAMKEGGRAKKF